MKTKHFLLLLFITAIALMGVAFYNGYPLLGGDSHAYIQMAILPFLPEDRTPFYGTFIRFTSLWSTLWFSIFAQCLLLSFVFLKYISLIKVRTSRPIFTGYPGLDDFRFNTVVVLTVVSFTCVSWISSTLMADIFAAVLFLTIMLFLSVPKGQTKNLFLYGGIIFLVISIHNSHFLITGLFGFVLLIAALIKKNKSLANRSLVLISLSLSIWVIMCSINAANNYGFRFSKGQNLFVVAKLAEEGILKIYLDDSCGKKDFKLCNYRDNIPTNFNEYLWMDSSPIHKVGGWDSCAEEYGKVVHDVFTTPTYVKMFVQKSAISTFAELTQIQVPEKFQSEARDQVQYFFSDEMGAYNSSLQNNGNLSGSACNIIYFIFFVLSSIAAIVCYPVVGNKNLSFIYFCIVAFFIGNALITSTFSCVNNRFENRIFWILPATNAIVILKYYFGKAENGNL